MQDKKILFPLVIKEATNLRKELKKKEKENLNFEDLDPNSARSCIYGQISGHCNNARAVRLIRSCCKKVYTPNYKSQCNLKNAIPNGSPERKKREDFWSPIEVFIIQRGQKRNTKKLISYIKGEINELTLD